MLRYYPPQAGAAFDAISRAVEQAIKNPPAFERLFSNSGSIGVDWDRAGRCHPSNELLVAVIGGMIDATAARQALGPGCSLAAVVDRVPSLDDVQQRIFLAAADDRRAPHNCLVFADAVSELIASERLEPYFEFGGEPAMNGYTIRPYGYAAAMATEGGPGELERTEAHAAGLPDDQRIPLVLICALYDGIGARDVFKGRGWSFHAVDLGSWMLDRFGTNERSARAALRTIGHYSGW